jgi:hypothetical protein
VILATNRIESLDPALLRPGRVDRKIEFPLPDAKTKRRIFGIHTGRMTLSEDVNLEEFVMSKDELSGADIKAVRHHASVPLRPPITHRCVGARGLSGRLAHTRATGIVLTPLSARRCARRRGCWHCASAA